MKMKIAERIVIDENILHGKPRIEGTRILVEIVLGLLGDGVTPEEIIRDHFPELTKEDVLACIQYAKEVIKEEVLS